MVAIIFQAASIYIFIFILFRIIGPRNFAQSTPFDVVLLLIISEATQQAMVGQDSSLTAAFTAIATLIGLDFLFATIRRRFKSTRRLLEADPVLLFREGKFIESAMRRECIIESDVLSAARESHGIDSLKEVSAAIVEASGHISIIPKKHE